MEININEIITDLKVLSERYLLRDGFVFVSLWGSANSHNIYNTIVIKNPSNVQCFSPRVISSSRSLQEHIEFINKYKVERALVIADSIEFITQCPTLHDLWIVPSESVGDNFDYSPLYKMPFIKKLHCPTAYGFKENFFTTIDCSQINGLESIHITNERQQNFNAITTLKQLGLTNYKKTDLIDVAKSAALESLTIIQSRIESLKGIQKFPKMKRLHLYYDRSLCDISALLSCKDSLTELRIENCAKIIDFSVLEKMENLEILELSGSNSIPNLQFLKKLAKLKLFEFSMNVEDGDLSPCLGISSVLCRKNRKHYNLKDSDLPKGCLPSDNDSI